MLLRVERVHVSVVRRDSQVIDVASSVTLPPHERDMIAVADRRPGVGPAPASSLEAILTGSSSDCAATTTRRVLIPHPRSRLIVAKAGVAALTTQQKLALGSVLGSVASRARRRVGVFLASADRCQGQS